MSRFAFTDRATRHFDTSPRLLRTRQLAGLNGAKGTAYVCRGFHGLQEAAMDRFVNRRNIEHYRRLRQTKSAAERLHIMKLLAEEKAKFNREFQCFDLAKVLCKLESRPG